MLDLDYAEDSAAEVDMNVVMTSTGRFVEVQGTAEGLPFARAELDEMLALAELGISQILEIQAEVLATSPRTVPRPPAEGSERANEKEVDMRLVLATANPDKAAELRAILKEELDDLVELVGRPSGVAEVEETGESLEDNARLKAVAIGTATGEAAVADDTGLEVAALGGAPGIWSARFAGEAATYADNVAKLLALLEGDG